MTEAPEPDYLAQTGDFKVPVAGQHWIRERSFWARKIGCRHIRASWSPEHELLLIEAWKVKPDDEGDPRWQLTHARSGHESGHGGPI